VVKQLHRQRGGQLGPLTLERGVGANWTIVPISDPQRLKAMRSLYLWVVGKPMLDLEKSEALLRGYLGKNFRVGQIPRCWARCGRWYEVPKGAVHVVNHHRTYCWVVPGREEELTKLTLTVLDVATVNPNAGPPPPTKTVVRTYDEVSKKHVSTTITTVEPVTE